MPEVPGGFAPGDGAAQHNGEGLARPVAPGRRSGPAGAAVGRSRPMSTRTLIILAAVCAILILAASAIQILIAR